MSDVESVLSERGECRWDLSLSRIRRALRRLGDPQREFRSVHVAGTNGKGTVCALIEASLRLAGFKTGMTISPHLCDVSERVRVGGVCVAREELSAAVAEVLGAETEPLTYFELVTAAAFLIFRKSKVEVAVVETGLGGRLDATNVLPPPALCVISSIGLDHTEHLGGTPGAIALEKAGILKPGSVCLCGDMAPEALAAVRAKGAEAGCPVFGPQTELRPAGVDWRGGWQELEGSEGSLRLNLLGAQAARNAALARDAARLLSDRGIEVPAEAFRSACWSVQWPARFQVVPVAGRVLVVDGAHNPPAMKAFLETWALSPFGGEGAMFLIGMLKDKDYRAMLGMAASHARQAISVRAPSPRALDPASASSLLSGLGSRVHACVDGPREAIERWLESPSPAAAACGSFTLAGAVLRELGLGAS